MSQRDLRTRNFPLLERIQRQIDNEKNFQNTDVTPEDFNKLGMMSITSAKPINTTPAPAKEIFTKLNLLNNKRRYR